MLPHRLYPRPTSTLCQSQDLFQSLSALRVVIVLLRLRFRLQQFANPFQTGELQRFNFLVFGIVDLKRADLPPR